MKNYYQILGIPDRSPIEKIRRTYRSLALQHHPDRGGDSTKMVEINEAYHYLQLNKATYDEYFKPRRPQVARYGFTIVVGGNEFSFTDIYAGTGSPATSTTFKF